MAEGDDKNPAASVAVEMSAAPAQIMPSDAAVSMKDDTEHVCVKNNCAVLIFYIHLFPRHSTDFLYSRSLR